MVKAIKFYADWCGPCKVYSKVWDKVKEELNGKVEFEECNVDEDTSGLAAKYKVRSIPFTVILNDGEAVRSQNGLINEKELKELLIK
jgi:thioredoxin 1|tara:strand:+ start:1582 stop:1842 length:261 start_codon:yes stop_codon:yes gene_type:complete